MKQIPLFLLPFLAVACSSVNTASKDEKHKTEIAINKLRSDIEDIRHDLNTYEIEHHILEGKLSDQESSIAELQNNVLETHGAKLQSIFEQIETLRDDCKQMQKKQKQVLGDLSEISHYTHDTTNALSQYKNKIETLEKQLTEQNRRFDNIEQLKETLLEIANYHQSQSVKTYVVKTGDSLEKIAKKFNTTIDEIKKLNARANDLIIVGEEIHVPATNE